jgi:hypothetical protein
VNLAGCIGIDRTTCTCTDAHNNKSTISSSGALQSARAEGGQDAVLSGVPGTGVGAGQPQDMY